MHVRKLSIHNIKCFQKSEFSFANDNGNTIAKWVNIIGENATGKTTVLQSIALLIGGEPLWGFFFKELTSYWPRQNSHMSQLSASIKENDDNLWEYGFFIRNQSITFADIYNKTPKGFSAAYGAFRRLSRKEFSPLIEFQEQGIRANFITLFDEDTPLTTFNQWISSLDYRSVKGDMAARRKLESGLSALSLLLPGGVEFDRSALDNDGQIRFIAQGTSVPTYALSDGYRSVLALGGDLIWRLINAFPDSEDPMKEEGVVLIDELDIHLHPRWQAWIAQKLRSAFPNIQFIVATHSPLVAMGAYWNGETGELRDDVLTLKLEINDGKASVQRIDDDLAAMDINRALESPAFGMVAPRPPEVEKKIDRYDELLEVEQRTAAEETELQKLQRFMAEVRPIGGKPAPGSFEAKLEDYLREKLG